MTKEKIIYPLFLGPVIFLSLYTADFYCRYYSYEDSSIVCKEIIKLPDTIKLEYSAGPTNRYYVSDLSATATTIAVWDENFIN